MIFDNVASKIIIVQSKPFIIDFFRLNISYWSLRFVFTSKISRITTGIPSQRSSTNDVTQI